MNIDSQSKQHDTVQGGYPIYGIPIGIIMFDCLFPRPVGDIGNALTFPFPVHYEILEGIPPEDLTKHGKKAAVEALISAGKRLQQRGVGAVVTSCGLLIRYQKLLSETLTIPVVTSSLILIPLLDALFPTDRKIGIITADAEALSPEVLSQAGWTQSDRIHIQGTEECPTFKKAIMEPSPPYQLDTEKMCEEFIRLCGRLIYNDPTIAALLLECTNLAPYGRQLSRTYSLPVFDITHCVHLLHTGIGY